MAPPLGNQRESFLSVAHEASWFLPNGHSALGIHLGLLACFPVGGCLGYRQFVMTVNGVTRGHQECFTLCQLGTFPGMKWLRQRTREYPQGEPTVFSVCIYV